MTQSEIIRVVVVVVLLAIVIARRTGAIEWLKEKRQKKEEQATAERRKVLKRERLERHKEQLETQKLQTAELLRQNLPGLRPGVAKIGGQDLHYAEGGDPAAPDRIVLLHGFAWDKEVWNQLAPRLLSRPFHIVTPDLPGFGQNAPIPKTDYGVTTQAKRIRALLQSLGERRHHLVGHSMGGNIAAALAYGAPDQIVSLTLIEPLGVRVDQESELDRFLAAERNPLVIAAPAAYDNLLGFLHTQPPTMSEALKNHRANLAAERRASYLNIWQQVMSGERAHLLDLLLPEIKTRTMIIQGRDSRVVHPATAEVIRAKMPEAATLLLEGCGHMAMVERPDETAAAICELIDSLTVSPQVLAG